MDGVKVMESQAVTHFNIPTNMTMHYQQLYGNQQYPVYQNHHSHPLGFYGSKYENSFMIEEAPVVTPPAEPKEAGSSPPPPPPPPLGHLRKLMRNKYTREQKSALERSFLTDGAYVSVRQREVIAEELGLSSKQVKVWYQNRRQKDKRRNQKLKQQQQQQLVQQNQDHVTVIKVPPSAGSPDSGVQDILDESRELIRSKEREIVYHQQQPVANNKVEDHRKSPVIQEQEQVVLGTEGGEVEEMKAYYDPTTTQQIYSLAAAAHYSTTATASASASSSSSSSSAYSPHSVQFDYSQAFANYYDYRGAYHQYYQQLMSGYQSQAQQFYSGAAGEAPQEAQTYSGY